jgi:hypothetical protein
MDISRIFDLFNNNESDQNDDVSLLIDFSDHPLYFIGGFNKVISNHLFFAEYTIKNFQKISPDIDIKELEKAGEELMFRKAWGYIKNLDLNKSFHLDSLKVKADKHMVHNLQISISFFEDLEEYEKCAFLKKIKDKIEEFLK